MTAIEPTGDSAISDVQRAAELRRIKAAASAVLALCLGLLVIARINAGRHPAFGFLAAFAEAAVVGGLADWYAVVALFRRPLGLPIPHTAIIQRNQARIADKLGEFVERQFLGEAAVEARLRRVDFAALASAWLGDAKRAGDLARFLLQLAPEALSAIDQSGLKSFVSRRINAQLEALDLGPLAASSLRSLIDSGRHRVLLDELLRGLRASLDDPQLLAAIRDKIRDELPTLLKLYRADKYVLNKLVASATAFFAEVEADPGHPFRGEFDRLMRSFADRLAGDPDYAGKLKQLQREILERPEWQALAQKLWASLSGLIAEGASGGGIHPHLAHLFVQAGRHLESDDDMRAEINRGLYAVLRRLVAEHKSEAASFIADQVKAWDMGQLVKLIELNVGRDLQYIRFNGTLIGGFAGLALHSAEVLLRLG
ncbi:DUF445 domain-containing protein [Bradyrhizobium sp. WD16]|uniref:DUF445 domain-containing protein n=1 Tax=Bradyrhizobium sp. WD16 TaxID=1521768 RepID=UPI0020A3806A|nr:DUF445 family protein [Bradyrhizobium sp. WD16]UTD26123.1 DUF445 domain-containing protein [Bradyrhizobium sp. WD16]